MSKSMIKRIKATAPEEYAAIRQEQYECMRAKDCHWLRHHANVLVCDHDEGSNDHVSRCAKRWQDCPLSKDKDNSQGSEGE